MLLYSKQIYLFFCSVLFQVQKKNTLYPDGLSKTKLYKIGCLIPLTTDPSITSHFKCI